MRVTEMRNLLLKGFVKLQDAQMQRQLHADEQGLSLLAYALGAAVIVAPLAVALLLFAQDTVTSADAAVDAAIGAAPVVSP